MAYKLTDLMVWLTNKWLADRVPREYMTWVIARKKLPITDFDLVSFLTYDESIFNAHDIKHYPEKLITERAQQLQTAHEILCKTVEVKYGFQPTLLDLASGDFDLRLIFSPGMDSANSFLDDLDTCHNYMTDNVFWIADYTQEVAAATEEQRLRVFQKIVN